LIEEIPVAVAAVAAAAAALAEMTAAVEAARAAVVVALAASALVTAVWRSSPTVLPVDVSQNRPLCAVMDPLMG
jgi:hypothetical protein